MTKKKLLTYPIRGQELIIILCNLRVDLFIKTIDGLLKLDIIALPNGRLLVVIV